MEYLLESMRLKQLREEYYETTAAVVYSTRNILITQNLIFPICSFDSRFIMCGEENLSSPLCDR